MSNSNNDQPKNNIHNTTQAQPQKNIVVAFVDLYRRGYRPAKFIIVPQPTPNSPRGVVILRHIKRKQELYAAVYWRRDDGWLFSDPHRLYIDDTPEKILEELDGQDG